MTDSTNDDHAHTAWLERRPAPLVLAIFLIGCAITVIISWQLWSDASERAAERQTDTKREVAAAIEFRMQSYVQVLQGIRGLHHADTAPDAEGFDDYVETIGVIDTLPGIQAIGWARRLDGADVDAYEADIQANDPFVPDDYVVRPRTGADELFVVEYVVSATGTRAALGFDLQSEPRRGEAIARARIADAPIATAPLNLVSNPEEVPSILVTLPTFASDGTLSGVAIAAFRTPDLLDATVPDSIDEIAVHDIGPTDAGTTGDAILLSGSAFDDEPTDGIELEIYGRRWLLTVPNTGGPPVLALLLGAGAGIALSAALAWAVDSSKRTAERAEHRALQLTADLHHTNTELNIASSRLEEGIRSAGVLVWERNLDSGETWTSTDLPGHEQTTSIRVLDRLADSTEASSALVRSDDGTTREEIITVPDDDGDEHWILSRSKLLERNGEMIIIGAHVDVTAEHRHIELVEQLNNDLTERNEALEEFTNVASHDLRAPLRAVRALVGFLREDAEHLGPTAELNLRRIDERAERMAELLDDLLTYARAHRRDEHRSVTSLDAEVDEALATIDLPEGLNVVADCDDIVFEAVRTPLAMCIRNLVDNAVKHHDKPDGTVEVIGRIDGDEAVVSVVDDGPGIPADEHRSIFEPFRRLADGPERLGSGIGLSVIERSTKVHDGSIEVSSELDHGSTFVLRWPIRLLDDETSRRPEQREPAGV